MLTLTIDPTVHRPPTRSGPAASALPSPKHIHTHPTKPAVSTQGNVGNASLTFLGTATTILSYPPYTILTDPNFLHAGEHVHLGPGVSGTRLTDPAVDMHELPNIDLVLLSHYHEDHFDKEVEDELRRDLPIITTPHAKGCLVDKKSEEERFTKVSAVDTWESILVDSTEVQTGSTKQRKSEQQGRDAGQGGDGKSEEAGPGKAIRITAMPGKHVPPGLLERANDLLGAVPPTNGWMVELGLNTSAEFKTNYRIYITGDTLLVDDLLEIPARYSGAGKPIDLMIAHLGGTTIPSPSIPLLMVTMDGKMGVELMKLMKPDITIPIHYDDYDVFASPLSEFEEQVKSAGLGDRVVFLDRGDRYDFTVG